MKRFFHFLVAATINHSHSPHFGSLPSSGTLASLTATSAALVSTLQTARPTAPLPSLTPFALVSVSSTPHRYPHPIPPLCRRRPTYQPKPQVSSPAYLWCRRRCRHLHQRTFQLLCRPSPPLTCPLRILLGTPPSRPHQFPLSDPALPPATHPRLPLPQCQPWFRHCVPLLYRAPALHLSRPWCPRHLQLQAQPCIRRQNLRLFQPPLPHQCRLCYRHHFPAHCQR